MTTHLQVASSLPIEHDDSHAETQGRMLPTLLLIGAVFLLQSNFRPGTGAEVSLDWQIAMRLGIAGLCGFYGLLNLGAASATLFRFPLLWMVLFAAWNIVSLPFAINHLHAFTSTACLLCLVLFVPAAVAKLGRKQVLLIVTYTLLAYLVGSWFYYYAFPSIGRDVYLTDPEVGNRLGGLGHPNSTGNFAALAILLLVVMGREGWASWLYLSGPILFSTVTLWATDCRTAVIALFGGLLAVLLQRGLLLISLIGGVFACAVLGAFALGLEVNPEALATGAARTGDPDEIYELNGRTELWGLVLQRTQGAPLVGYGYGCQRFVIETLGLEWVQYHAHNLLLQTVLGTGWIGGVLLVGMFASLAFERMRGPAAFPDGIFAFMFISGIAHCVMFTPIPDSNTTLWILALMWRQSSGVVAEVSCASRAPVHHRSLELTQQST